MLQSMRAVVVGTGFIGPVHVEGLRRAGVEVAGIVGSTPEKSMRAATQLGLPPRFQCFDDVLAADDVESVHLATPNVLHFDQARSVLRAGKHCLCEKPLAMTSVQTAELVKLAAASNVAAGVAYNIRYYPLCHEVASRMRAGEVGELLHVTGSYVQDWLLKPTDFNWRVLASAGGPLRAVADIGTHWLDLVQFMVGEKVVAVCADLRTVHARRYPPQGSSETFTKAGNSQVSGREDAATEATGVDIDTEDCGCVMLRFAGGANGSLWVSQTTAGRKNCLRFEIAGARHSLGWNSEEPNQLWMGHRDRANETLIRDPGLLKPAAAKLANYPGGHNEGFPDTFKQLFRDFYAYAAAADWTRTPPYPTFADGHDEVALCEAILRSHQTQRWISIGS
jgi:predicted dehydrogenase